MNCNNCSKCCEDIILPLAVKPDEDIKRWIELHNLKIFYKGEIVYLKINHKCSKLINGRCSIYEQRPNNCREYECENNFGRPNK